MDFGNPRHVLAAAQKVRAEYLKGAKAVSISAQQAASTVERPPKGPMWVSKFSIAKARPGSDNSRDLLLGLIDCANERNVHYDKPDSVPLDMEWVGYRRDSPRAGSLDPLISEETKFQKLKADTTTSLTVFYIYGGTFVLNTPTAYRKRVAALARSTGGKVLMVRQRLAPQHPFPAALLDVLQAYLALLAPPQGSPHSPIPPSSLVIAGDSSGACLALGLLQALLRLQRSATAISFHGQQVEPRVPSGMALLSPVADLTNAFPSFERNAMFDIFPIPIEKLPYLDEDFPTCPIWPASRARANLYCEAGMLSHPLASPAASDDWRGSCPLWFASGQEQIVDASRLVIQTAHRQGVAVTLQEYEGMPHTFFWLFGQAPQTKKVLEDWSMAIRNFAKGSIPASRAEMIRIKGLVVTSMQLTELVTFTVAQGRELMWKKTFHYKVPESHVRLRSAL